MNNTRHRILFLCAGDDAYEAAPARRLEILLAGLDRQRFAPALLFPNPGVPPVRLPQDVCAAQIGPANELTRNLPAGWLPDVVELHGSPFLAAKISRGRPAAIIQILQTTPPASFWSRLLQRWSARHCDRFIAVSDAIKDCHVAAGWRPDKIRVVHNPVAAGPGMPRDEARIRLLAGLPGLSAESRLLGAALPAGAADPGLVACLDAAGLLQAQIPAAAMVLLTPGGSVAAVRARAATAGLCLPMAVFETAPDCLSGLFSGLDIFMHLDPGCLLPDLPLAAMAAGVPVVAGPSPGGCEALADGDGGGLLVASGTPAAAARAVCLVLGEPELQRRLASSGRKRAAEFSAERFLARTGEVYEDLSLGMREGRQAGHRPA